jgi:hypothetical protein
MNERDQFWNEWFAKRRRVEAQIETSVQKILREGYSAIGEPTPYREHVKRANRDRKGKPCE